MTDKAKWIQREVLIRLALEGQVRASRNRLPEIDALLSLGWIHRKLGSVSLLIPYPDRAQDLRQRLTFVWPDWQAEVEVAISQELDPYCAATYAS